MLNTIRRFSDGGDLSRKHTDWFAALPSCIITPTLCWLGEHVYTLSAMFPPDSSAPLMDLVSRGQSPLLSRVTRMERILLPRSTSGPRRRLIRQQTPGCPPPIFLFVTAGLKHANSVRGKMIYFPQWEAWDLNLKWLNGPRVSKTVICTSICKPLSCSQIRGQSGNH